MKKNAVLFAMMLVLAVNMLSFSASATNLTHSEPEVPAVNQSSDITTTSEAESSTEDSAGVTLGDVSGENVTTGETSDENVTAGDVPWGELTDQPENPKVVVEFSPEENQKTGILFVSKNVSGEWEVTGQALHSSVFFYVLMIVLLILITFAVIVVVNLIIIKIYKANT